MPELPNKRYLRRGEICGCFGIDDEEFTKLVRAKVLRPLYLNGKGRAFFRRDEVLEAETGGKIFRPEQSK